EVVGERRQPKAAGRRGRQQRAGFGVELAEPQEIARQLGRQNGEVALHVARSDAGRLALESAAAGRKPRVAAGLRGGGRLARRAGDRHGAPLLGAEPQKPAPVDYLIIRLGAENWLRDEVRSIGPTPRHRRRVVGARVLKYPTKRQDNLLTEGSMMAGAGRRGPGHWPLLMALAAPSPATGEEHAMTDKAKTQDWSEEFWYSGKVTRRRLIGYGSAAAGALGATMLVPAPWQPAFGQAKPYKIGTEQPLSGAGAAGGKTALVGVQMAVDRINKSGGINGRPIELIVADDESKPDVGRRKVEKLLVE